MVLPRDDRIRLIYTAGLKNRLPELFDGLFFRYSGENLHRPFFRRAGYYAPVDGISHNRAVELFPLFQIGYLMKGNPLRVNVSKCIRVSGIDTKQGIPILDEFQGSIRRPVGYLLQGIFRCTIQMNVSTLLVTPDDIHIPSPGSISASRHSPNQRIIKNAGKNE